MDLLTVFIALSAAVGAFLLRLISAEVQDWLPMLARKLVERAVSRLPKQRQERYREEWLSHLEECPGKLSKLIHSIGCWFSARKVASALVKPAIADVELHRLRDRDLIVSLSMLDYLITEISHIDAISAYRLVSARKSLAQASTESRSRPPEPSK